MVIMYYCSKATDKIIWGIRLGKRRHGTGAHGMAMRTNIYREGVVVDMIHRRTEATGFLTVTCLFSSFPRLSLPPRCNNPSRPPVMAAGGKGGVAREAEGGRE